MAGELRLSDRARRVVDSYDGMVKMLPMLAGSKDDMLRVSRDAADGYIRAIATLRRLLAATESVTGHDWTADDDWEDAQDAAAALIKELEPS